MSLPDASKPIATLDVFERELEKLIGKPTLLRPFVCDGSPLACKAFIVGFNPATEMRTAFWDFWRSGTGFDKAAWFQCYREERVRRPLAPGKKYRPTVSPSRRVIEWIIEEAGPVAVLETNIHAIATEKARELGKDQRVTEPFEFLVRRLQPAVIVVHGKEALAYLRGKDMLANITVLERPHFSRGWSEASARELGRDLRRIAMAAAQDRTRLE